MVPPQRGLLTARLANLVGADPFSFNGPCAETLVFWVISSEVAMLDQASPGVTAMKVDDFVLCCCKLMYGAWVFLTPHLAHSDSDKQRSATCCCEGLCELLVVVSFNMKGRSC